MRRLTYIITLLLLLQTCLASAQGEWFVPLQDYPFVYLSSDEEASLPAISDSVFNVNARGVGFRVNRSELLPDDPFIQTYEQQIVPMLRDRGLVLRHVIVRGAASPEGPYDNNCRLSRARTLRLLNFLGTKLENHFDASRIQYSSICEDYEYLVLLMRQAHDAEAEAVADVWRTCAGDERLCKSRLQALNGGRLWQRLLKDYFPQLRQARVMLFFGRVPAATTTRFPELPALRPSLSPSDLLVQELPGTSAMETSSTDSLSQSFTYPLLPLYAVRHTLSARLPVVALRTNLVHDFFYMPNFGFAPSVNVQLEFFPRCGHLTYNLGFSFSNHTHYADHKFFQMRDAQLELRRYFRKGHPYRGAYLAAYAHGFVYGIGFGTTRGWEGEGLGAGLSGGYTMRLTRCGHFRLEFMAALGFLATKYDPYVWGNPITGDLDGKYYYDYQGMASKFKKRNHLFTWLGPTNVGIQLTYDIIYRKRGKGGER